MTIARALRLLPLLLPFALTAQAPAGDADWIWRLDGEQRRATDSEPGHGEWRYDRMPPGWHVTTTERGVSLFPRDRVLTGRWGIEVELFLFPDPSEAPLGIVIEAADVQPAGSMQARFVMRRDGAATVVARHGGIDTTIVGWKTDTAVAGHGGGVVRYLLRVMHEAGALAFSINGREMMVVPARGLDHPVTPGLRIGPGLNVHVSRFDLLTPLAPPRPRRQ